MCKGGERLWIMESDIPWGVPCTIHLTQNENDRGRAYSRTAVQVCAQIGHIHKTIFKSQFYFKSIFYIKSQDQLQYD